ncbi:MAG: TonB family protein [Nitrospirota bacterium]
MNGPERVAFTSFERRRWAAGWTWSVLLHALVVAASLGVMANLHPAPEQEPFRWEVSLVEAPRHDVAAESAPAADVPTPSQPRVQPASREPVRPTQQPVVRRVETRPIEETVEREIRQVVTAVQPVKPVMEVQTRAVLPQPIQQPETVPRERAPLQRVAGTEPVGEPAPVMTETKPVAAELALVAKAPSVVQQPEPTSLAAVPTQSAVVVERQPIVEQPAVTPITRNPAPIPDAAPVQANIEPPARSAVADHGEPEAPAPTAQETASQIAAVPRSAPATKADYSWLAESLWRRVVELKRYPHEARLNRWEGKVVLKAVIREDGHLGDLQIQKSSGYDILDQDAMELVRKACPLHLKHPLGRPEVVLQIPINYALR